MYCIILTCIFTFLNYKYIQWKSIYEFLFLNFSILVKSDCTFRPFVWSRVVWKSSQRIILICVSLNWIEFLADLCVRLPGSESTDCAFATESRSFSLSSAAESRPLWLSATDAPPDSSAAICRQNNAGLRHRVLLLRLAALACRYFAATSWAWLSPAAVASPAAPCTTCPSRQDSFSAPLLSSQSQFLWGPKAGNVIGSCVFKCQSASFKKQSNLEFTLWSSQFLNCFQMSVLLHHPVKFKNKHYLDRKAAHLTN